MIVWTGLDDFMARAGTSLAAPRLMGWDGLDWKRIVGYEMGLALGNECVLALGLFLWEEYLSNEKLHRDLESLLRLLRHLAI